MTVSDVDDEIETVDGGVYVTVPVLPVVGFEVEEDVVVETETDGVYVTVAVVPVGGVEVEVDTVDETEENTMRD